jgi:uncharacterized membrane protein
MSMREERAVDGRAVSVCLLFVLATLGLGLLVAWLLLGAVGLWFIYRIARGWLRLKDRQPMYG